jgi:FAD/FMN-containing dehydrogenase/Fe-S oxidoreductase
VADLAADLQKGIRGEVRFDAASRALYSTDSSNYRQIPIGVIVPRDADDVEAAVAVCRSRGAPVIARGGGTSLAGQCCNVAVVLDMSKYMDKVISIDPERKLAVVQPGVVLDKLRKQAEEHRLTFGPDPSTHDHCTLGGMIGNNSCGTHSVMAGRTSDNVEELEILTYGGLRMRVGKTSDSDLEQGGRSSETLTQLRSLRDRYAGAIRERFPDIPRLVSGYNLRDLLPENGFHVARSLVGSECTCALVLEATVKLVPSPTARSLVVLGYPDVYRAADDVPHVMEHRPIGLEGIDDRLVSYMEKKHMHPEDIGYLPSGGGWLLAEFGGDSREEADERADGLMQSLRRRDNPPSMKLFDDPAEEAHLWEVRESGLGATAYVPGMADTWEGWEDSAVPPEALGDYLRELRKLMRGYGYEGSFYGHFGQGCLHTRINFDLLTAAGIAKWRAFLDGASDLVLRHGGSFSGEHGDGQSRAELLPKMFGDELMRAFREFKAIWDPDHKMNPGKVVEPYRITDYLKLGTDYNPSNPKTHFAYAEDGGSFAHAALRCVGVGKCRRDGGGTMCPSYMVTKEEKHSTRGRARLLFEMLEGDVVTKGWREDAVHDALELCLACKGCKGECPVNVDMATYKAEFYSHYYRHRLRPVQAYSLGLIYWWARLASKAPRVANAVAQTPVLARPGKAGVGLAPQREIPPFAEETFRAWFERRSVATEGSPRVILWPDTFNNFLHPEVCKSAVSVLEHAGCVVDIPRRVLCCGRPLYDYGMLNLAKRLLRQTLRTLRDDIRSGVSFVGVEPSCTAVFRDELANLLPHDEDAERLKQQFFTLAEFLNKIGYDPPRLNRRALVHVHCHHKAIVTFDADQRLLDKLGLDYEILDSGCCGLAGSFGFERGEKYEVSMRCGERALFPAVRGAPNDMLIITDGFSCHTQMQHGTGRRALHLAQLLRLAIDGGTAPDVS